MQMRFGAAVLAAHAAARPSGAGGGVHAAVTSPRPIAHCSHRARGWPIKDPHYHDSRATQIRDPPGNHVETRHRVADNGKPYTKGI